MNQLVKRLRDLIDRAEVFKNVKTVDPVLTPAFEKEFHVMGEASFSLEGPSQLTDWVAEDFWSRVGRSPKDWNLVKLHFDRKRSIVIRLKPAVYAHVVEGVLHCSTGPAIEFADGAKGYFWKGLRMPAEAIMHPDTFLTAKKILAEQNMEIRRSYIEIIGGAKFTLMIGAKKVHKDEFGELYKKRVENGIEFAFAKVKNSTPEPDGSFKDYWLRVDPRSETCYEAVGRSFLGDRWQQYNPQVQT